jgi:hypothetical protein
MVLSLPREILNCILGVAAVHMAARNPANRAMERIALETKVSLFQGINRLFQESQHQRVDVLFCCMSLMFAMDVSSMLLKLDALFVRFTARYMTR